MISFIFDVLITVVRTIFRKTRFAGILLLLLIIELFVVAAIETSQMEEQSMRPDLKLVSAQFLGYTEDGQARIQTQIENQGGRTSEYPYLQIRTEDGTFYPELDPAMRPLEYSSVTEIPGGETVSGTYVLNEYDAEQIKGETAALSISEYDCIRPSEYELQF